MKPAEVEGFAYLCKALMLEDGPEPSALSVFDPATGKFLNTASCIEIPTTRLPAIPCTPINWAVSAKVLERAIPPPHNM
jgi:hypothetical protein